MVITAEETCSRVFEILARVAIPQPNGLCECSAIDSRNDCFHVCATFPLWWDFLCRRSACSNQSEIVANLLGLVLGMVGIFHLRDLGFGSESAGGKLIRSVS